MQSCTGAQELFVIECKDLPNQTFTLPAPPNIKSGREIYDSIMEQIEPELTSHQILLLKNKYTNEAPEEKRTRGERYKRAFIKYYEMFEIYMADMHERIKRYQRDAMKTIEKASKWEDEMKLDNMSASMFKLT